MTQLALSLDSKESPEIIDLVFRAKNGDDEAGNQLFTMFKGTLYGDKISRKLNWKIYSDYPDGEDTKSIINEIFMMSIKSYDPKRAKFITHLMNMIGYKFRVFHYGEKLIPIRKNLSTEEMKKLSEKTAIVFENFSADKKQTLDKIVCFNISDEEFYMPESAFISKFIVDKVKEIVPVSWRKIYKYYLKCVLNGEKNPHDKTNDKFKLKGKQLRYIIVKSQDMINKSLSLRNVRYV